MTTPAPWVRPSERHKYHSFGDSMWCHRCSMPPVHAVHDVPAHFAEGANYDAEKDFAQTGAVLCDDCGARVCPRTLESLPEHGCIERQRAQRAATRPEED